MAPAEFRRLEKLLKDGDYAALEALVSEQDLKQLAAAWAMFEPLQKLVLFKLMDAPRAMQFYSSLSFKEKYFLLCGFPMNAIAPILEDLPPSARRRFVQLPREFYDRMFRQLVSERVEMTVALRNN